MNYANFFKYQEQAKVLEDGCYTIELQEPFETKIANYNVLRFPFKVVGENGLHKPDYFDLFDVTDETNQMQIDNFVKTASKIKACFLLQGQFIPTNYPNWKGKSGKVYIKKNKEGFTNVVNFIRNENYEQYKTLL